MGHNFSFREHSMAQTLVNSEGSADLGRKLKALLDPKSSVATDEIQALISLLVDDIVYKVSHTGIPEDEHQLAISQIPPILDFLETCRLTQEPSFKTFAVKKMAKLKGSLSAEKKEVGPKTLRNIRLPSASSSLDSGDSGLDEGDLLVDDLFAKALVDHISDRLTPFTVPNPDEKVRLPYIYCPEFHAKFSQAVKNYIVPTMLDSRRLRTFLDGLSMDGGAYEALREDFTLAEKENTVRHMWEDYWGGVRSTLIEDEDEEDEEEDFDDIINGGKSEGMFGKIRKMAGKTEEKKTVIKAETIVDETIFDLWEILITPSPGRDYLLPDVEDISLFQALFQFPVDQLAKNTIGVKQLLEQETDSGGRVGSSRDHMCRLVRTLPPYCGEIIAAWSYYAASNLFTPEMRHSFLTSLGKSEDIRRNMVPYFYRWVPKN